MDRAYLEQQIANFKQQEQQARITAEQASGARQLAEHLLKRLDEAESKVREFPVAVPTGTS